MAQTRPSPTLSRGFTRLGRFLAPYGNRRCCLVEISDLIWPENVSWVEPRQRYVFMRASLNTLAR